MSVAKRSPDQFNSDHLNINAMRKVVREQTNLNLKYTNEIESDDSDIEVRARHYTPLPDIPRVDDTYYRTESSLIKHDSNHDRQTSSHSHKSKTNEICTQLPSKAHIEFFRHKEVKHHFASTTKPTRPTIIHRLPALDKQLNGKYVLQNAMDLDEDLPESLDNHKAINMRQRMTYTSPGDRTISPIKRPQAPSPPNSSINFRKKATTQYVDMMDTDDENDDDDDNANSL